MLTQDRVLTVNFNWNYKTQVEIMLLRFSLRLGQVSSFILLSYVRLKIYSIMLDLFVFDGVSAWKGEWKVYCEVHTYDPSGGIVWCRASCIHCGSAFYVGPLGDLFPRPNNQDTIRNRTGVAPVREAPYDRAATDTSASLTVDGRRPREATVVATGI